MNQRSLTWAIPAVLYVAFFAWYTNLAGPLDEAEIADYLQRFEAAGLPPERIATLRRFMQENTGDDFYMLNALDKTIAYPIEPRINLGEPRFLVALILLSIALAARLASRRKQA